MTEKEDILLKETRMREDKRVLSCTQAMKLSREQGVTLKEIGEMCNNLGIKIIDCELGCFK